MFASLLIIIGALLFCSLYCSMSHYLKKWTWDEMRMALASFWCSVMLTGSVYTVVTGAWLY